MFPPSPEPISFQTFQRFFDAALGNRRQHARFASFAAALRAGNSDAIVAFNPGVRVPVVAHTKYEDFVVGEVNLDRLSEAGERCPGRWIERDGAKIQFHVLTYLGQSWCRGERPQWSDEKVIGVTRQIIDKGGVITFDVPIQKGGRIPQSFIDQLQAVGEAIGNQDAGQPSGDVSFVSEMAEAQELAFLQNRPR